MSTTRIDYHAVVKELSKGLIGLNSKEARSCGFLPYIALGAFRTIRLGAGRQQGLTTWMYDQLDEDTLVLAHGRLYTYLVEDYARRFPEGPKATFLPGKTFHQYVNTRKWKKVFVVDSGIYFHNNKYNTFYKRLVDMVDDNVVIYMLN